MLLNFVLSLSLLTPVTYEEFVSADTVRIQMESLYRVAQQETQNALWEVDYWKESEQEEWVASVPHMMAGNMVAAQYYWQRAEVWAVQKRMWETELVLLRQEENDAFARWYEALERVRLIFEELKRFQSNPYR